MAYSKLNGGYKVITPWSVHNAYACPYAPLPFVTRKDFMNPKCRRLEKKINHSYHRGISIFSLFHCPVRN